jgi:hypothetical protein
VTARAFLFRRPPDWGGREVGRRPSGSAEGARTRQSSPHVHSDAPKTTRSLSRNCPGTTDSAGKPPADASQTPGVVSRKLSVVRHVQAAAALPARAVRAESGREAMSRAVTISAAPSMAEKPRTPNSG